MKKIRFLGFIVAALAVAVLITGIYANNAKNGDGDFAKTLAAARETVSGQSVQTNTSSTQMLRLNQL